VAGFGVHFGLEGCGIDVIRHAWLRAEAMGYDWISVWDHFTATMGPASTDVFEAIACHAALAEATSRVRVGSLVYSAGYRHPAVLANAAATIDHISGGRLELGIGAGWLESEYAAYGIPFEAPGPRLRRLREAVEVIRLLWTQELATYQGEFYTLTNARCHPKPLQAAPRIWVGAPGERTGIKTAAQVADGWNCTAVSPETFARKRQILLDAAPDPDRLQTSITVGLVLTDGDPRQAMQDRYGEFAGLVGGVDATLVGSVPRVLDLCGRYLEAGADWIILREIAPFDMDGLTTFATEVMPALSTVTTASPTAT
jgi:alkanesulfonate monooxygenase SsuD/methylene tetrahydromethanopterin reductase-like flavin-dependent oxidoreductase (luciferase family)